MISPKSLSGAGLVFRLPHLDPLLSLLSTEKKSLNLFNNLFNWFELLGDNFLSPQLPVLSKIDELRKKVPFVLHLTNLSLASPEPLNREYLLQVDGLVQRYDPTFISDHLCWSNYQGSYLHDLLPFPFTHQALKNISDKIKQLQDRWQRPFLVENISSYLSFSEDMQDYSEVDFINLLMEKSGGNLLLDINNIYVSCMNHKKSYEDFIQNLNLDPVLQIHLAGFSKKQNLLIDTHSHLISEEVWDLFLKVIQKKGKTPSVLEWDHELPSLQILLDETIKIQKVVG
jgi:uncharacterized protein (UPF0276 family)